MSLQISAVAEAYLNDQNIEPNIILEIDGIPYIFGAQAVFEIARIGEFVIGDGTKIGGVVRDNNSKDWIMLKGTTNNISQQISIDKAEGSSVTSFKISLIDKSAELTRIFSPGDTVEDILGREARIYWQPKGTAHPRDSAVLFIGIIDRISLKQGSIALNVSHPDQLKRQELLPKVTCKLTADMSATDTIAFVDNVTGFLEDQDSLSCYIRINDEIIKYHAIVGGNFFNCARGQLGTIAQEHSIDDDVESFYQLKGKPFSLARKILLSDPNNYYFGETEVKRFVETSSTLLLPNALFFDEFNIQERLGLIVGDTLVCSFSSIGGNNGSATITGFGQNDLGSYVLTNKIFDIEKDSGALCKFHSKWNVLSFGCSMKPYQVDLDQFDLLDTLVGNQHPDLNIYVKDTIRADEFLNKEIYFPVGVYSVPRKGRVSINVTIPPIATAETPLLDETNITNGQSISVERTTNERFYNAIVYKYDIDSIEDKFLAARIGQSAESINRIKVGNKVLTIESKGLRNDAATNNLIDIQINRFLDRYKFGAEKINVGIKFSIGFKVEIGDTVVFDGSELQVSDSKTGTRDFSPRIMEVTNKSINLKSGSCELELTDTLFSAQARYGTFSPSSIVASGSTTTAIRIQKSYGTNEFQIEVEKWRQYVGERIVIRSEDHDTIYQTRLVGINPARVDELIVSPAITTPNEGFIVECPAYDQTSKREMRLWKAIHCFWNPQDSVVSGTTTTITVADGSLYFVGCTIRIHSQDYADDHETIVSEIVGNVVTFKDACPFTPESTHLVDNIGFSGDNGLYYALF